MPTDHTAEEAMPDTLSPDDALMIALTNKRFARHVLEKAIKGQVPGQAGAEPKMHNTARQRHNAKAIRENKVKASELPQRSPHSGNGTSSNRTSLKPLWDGDQLRTRLQSYDRTPFLDLLAIWMECTPSPQTIMAFADKYPDRWTKAMVDLGRLGGFAEKKEIDVNFAAKVARMSDSQLEDQLREEAYRLGIPLPNLISDMRTVGSADPRRGDVVDVMVEARGAGVTLRSVGEDADGGVSTHLNESQPDTQVNTVGVPKNSA